jgi:hypothetical protein
VETNIPDGSFGIEDSSVCALSSRFSAIWTQKPDRVQIWCEGSSLPVFSVTLSTGSRFRLFSSFPSMIARFLFLESLLEFLCGVHV